MPRLDEQELLKVRGMLEQIQKRADKAPDLFTLEEQVIALAAAVDTLRLAVEALLCELEKS